MGYYAVIREKPSDIEHGIKKVMKNKVINI